MDTILRRLVGTGLRRGLGGSRAWMVVGISAAGVRVLRRLASPKPEVLYRTLLRPGDRIEVVTRPPR